MELASGFNSANINPFEGFNNAVNSTNQTNNWLNNYNSQIGAASTVPANTGNTNQWLGQLNSTTTNPGADPFASGGGFGKMTDYYSKLGAEYGRHTGGFGAVTANQGDAPALDWKQYLNPETASSNRDILAASYLTANKDIADAAEKAGGNPYDYASQHYANFGKNENRGFFDAAEYQRENPDVFKAGANPFEHYLNFGQQEGRFAPTSGGFNAETYKAYNPDVPAAGVDPWTHWTQYGQKEGRSGAVETGGYNSDPNFDTAGYFKAHPDQYQAFHNVNNTYTNPTAFAEMSNYQSPSNDYNTFQKGPTYDWQSAIPEGRRDPRVINEVYRSAGETGLPPAVIASILNMESVWNPGNRTGDQYGLPQMSANMWGDNPFRGTMGGSDFNTFKNDPVGDKQIRAYTDWLIRGGKLNRNGIDVAAQSDPAMQAAMLQAIQFAGNSSGWRTALGQGNKDTYVTTEHPQASELRPGGEAYPTINSMYNAYNTILGRLRR